MYEQQEPDTDPTKVRAAEDQAEVEAHKLQRRARTEAIDDEPDVEAHRMAAPEARARRR